ncbi:hypothetical protein BGW36DRAFT_148652 [Talaromyces proteolyticus]|uniref:Zn(2)-C6 fungal-type domain-containing protein n=1 Tax=Talaromyces proteolyticus TaxID=1131652 RepID=A0AAD4KSW9_9EURO|nr:uncharacterized protein BGW36DRAFT_148652 [Talaromyces proteolyticus]KAH8698588.1 hypothetical protein BGW36DRAFT_148652 [Talaromyces proteolyticus]
MVYCARPSKNCLGCRQRRIKCDLRVPACTQCKRASMKCAGYRDQLALLFRDENARTQHRSVTAKDRSRQAETCWNKIQVDRLSLAATPSKSLDEGGLSFFLDRFTTAPQWSSIDQSSMSVTVHPFIKSIVAKEQTRDALISVGLAALSNVTGDKACLKVALQKYVNGIKHVREALEEPTKTDLDDTLKLAVILALFELVSTSPGHLNSWNIHTNGALALFRHLHHGRMPVKPRNMADLQSYTFFILKYFTSGGDIPSEILDWSPPNYSSQILNTAAALISILVRFVRYSAVLQDPTFNMNTEEAVRAAFLIDTALNDWEASLFSDDSWSYVTQESSELFGVYQGKCHVYKNIWASRILNHYRWARIRVNELLYLYTSKLTNPTASQLVHQQTALSTISRMATDICISVPNHCRLMGFGFGSLASREADVPPLNGVFILVFPLIIAGSAIGVSDELHEWIVKTLGMIGSTMGIGHAAESISVVKTIREVKKRQDVVSWNAALIFPMHG